MSSARAFLSDLWALVGCATFGHAWRKELPWTGFKPLKWSRVYCKRCQRFGRVHWKQEPNSKVIGRLQPGNKPIYNRAIF